MQFSLELDYTPRGPQPGVPFTESSFRRKGARFTLDTAEIGVVLVDLWNVGREGGPVGPTLGPELSTERGISHARRKRQIIEAVIAPTVTELRSLGVPIFHGNHAEFLERYPQWIASTTEAEREARKAKPQTPAPAPEGKKETTAAWPPPEWVRAWRERHRDLVFNWEWSQKQAKEVYPQIDIPAPVKPRGGDLLVYSREQFHRLLTERRIRVLFYMGFETDECLQFTPYGMANMQDLGYLCVVVRDGTTTYESAETLEGLWRTKVEIERIEKRWGYSVASQTLRHAVGSAR